MTDTLYEQDFYRWAQEQAAAPRARVEQGANLPVDWENVADEDLGTAHRSELRSRLRTIVEHLIKLRCSTSWSRDLAGRRPCSGAASRTC